MTINVNAFHHKEWAEHSLAEYGDFADYVEYVNQRELGDGTYEGEWYYIPDEVLPPMKGVDYEGKPPNERVIYFGTFGNDHSPGASSYTNAEIFDMDDEEEAKEFEERKKEWESKEEYLESEFEDEDSDEEEESEEDDEEE